jgi:hypothetical protein
MIKKKLNRALFLWLLAGALAGCISQAPVKFDVKVSNTLPKEIALDYLTNLDVTFNKPPHVIFSPRCGFSDAGIAGTKVVWSTPERTSTRPFSQWFVSEIRTVGGKVQDVFVKNQEGATCAPLRTHYDFHQKKVIAEVEKTLTALVSLGVRYDPRELSILK